MVPQNALFADHVSPGEAVHQDLWGTLRLFAVPGIGSVHFRALLRNFGSPKEVFRASRKALESIPGIGPQTAEEIRNSKQDGALEKSLKKLEESHARMISIWDASYPPRLKQIHDPPALLFVRGSLPESEEVCVAIVGTRSPNLYGLDQAKLLADNLAKQGIGIVSGMALGIDSAAHEGALRADGKTYAVFGCGVDYIYPPGNKELAEKIAASGGLISEFLPGTRPDAGLFPRRNRVISGLSVGVVVVQGGVKSGALITAKCALEQNREVFAVPGNVANRLSAGPHQLIKQGAAMVTSAEDILREVGVKRSFEASSSSTKSLPLLNASEEIVARKLSNEPIHIDRLVHELNRPVSSILADLLSLEMKGWVVQLPGKLFALKEG